MKTTFRQEMRSSFSMSGQEGILLHRPHGNDQRGAAAFPVGRDDLGLQHFGQVQPEGHHVSEDADLYRRAFAEVLRQDFQVWRQHGMNGLRGQRLQAGVGQAQVMGAIGPGEFVEEAGLLTQDLRI